MNADESIVTGTLTSTALRWDLRAAPPCYVHHMSCRLLEMHRDSASNPSLSIRGASLGPFRRRPFISEAHYARQLLIVMQHTHAHGLVWLKDDPVASSGDTKRTTRGVEEGARCLFLYLSHVKHRKSAPASGLLLQFYDFFFIKKCPL